MLHADGLLLLPRLQVQNANAVSGPLTWGFPSITAFTGFTHALQRQLSSIPGLTLGGVAVICHRFEPQVSQPAGKRTKVFNLSRNPLASHNDRKKIAPDSSFTAPSFSEEGRTHMEISLLLEVHATEPPYEHQIEALVSEIQGMLQRMRIAGGSLLPLREGKRYRPSYIPLQRDSAGQHQQFRELRRRLLPGFALVSAEWQLEVRIAQGEVSEDTQSSAALDAWLDLSRLNIEPPESGAESGDAATEWRYRRAEGWVVPIPVGYAAIAPLYEPGEVANARDRETPFRFVESLYSLGQWISPHRVGELEQLFWRTSTNVDEGLYLCSNTYSAVVGIGD